MLGGSLTRYHTPTLKGRGFLNELVKVAGPSVVRSLGHGLQAYGTAASAAEALKRSETVLQKDLKRKMKDLDKPCKPIKRTRQREKDILGV